MVSDEVSLRLGFPIPFFDFSTPYQAQIQNNTSNRQNKFKKPSKRYFSPSYQSFSHPPTCNPSGVDVFGLWGAKVSIFLEKICDFFKYHNFPP